MDWIDLAQDRDGRRDIVNARNESWIAESEGGIGFFLTK